MGDKRLSVDIVRFALRSSFFAIRLDFLNRRRDELRRGIQFVGQPPQFLGRLFSLVITLAEFSDRYFNNRVKSALEKWVRRRFRFRWLVDDLRSDHGRSWAS